MAPQLFSKVSHLVKRSLGASEGRRRLLSQRLAGTRRRLLRLESLENRRVLAVFVVDSTADTSNSEDGVMTLREAIIAANIDSVVDRIEFEIPVTDPGYDLATGIWTIQPGVDTSGDPLPDITEAVELLGSTQPRGGGFEFDPNPNIQLNGFFAAPGGLPSNGLSLVDGSDGSTISGLVINGFSGAGIYITSNDNLIENNYVGTNFDGTSPVPNRNGVEIYDDGSGGGDDNQVVGNLISGNGGFEVTVDGTDMPWDWDDEGLNSGFQFGAQDGTPATVVDLSSVGIAGLGEITISYRGGLTGAFEGGAQEVDGRGYNGIDNVQFITNDFPGFSTKFFPSKYIDSDFYDIYLNALVGTFVNSSGAIVGSPFVVNNGPLSLAIPSGATQLLLGINDDIYFDNSGALNVLISGVFLDGIHDGNGVYIHGERDLGEAASGNSIERNLIGTDASGLFAVPNSHSGVAIFDAATLNSVGGPHDIEFPKRNVIAGNLAHGVDIAFGASFNTVQGNYIGINSIFVEGSLGTIAIPNGGAGVLLNLGATHNLIGSDGDEFNGTEFKFEEGNVISANLSSGVAINDFATSHNTVAGNLLGTDITGFGSIGNAGGVELTSRTHDNLIGGTSESERNIISGNVFQGIGFFGGGTNNRIQGNYIGTDITGESDLGNGGSGIVLNGFSDGETSGNIIGGLTAAEGNVISGNAFAGIVLIGSNAFENVIQSNYIGTDLTASDAIANGSDGIEILDGAHDNIVGGLTTSPGLAPGNIISGNTTNGVYIDDSTANDDDEVQINNVVQGNLIGVSYRDNDGQIEMFVIANGGHGVLIESSSYNLIGGPDTGETEPSGARNIISGNLLDGVHIEDFNLASYTVVQGNYIGTDITGKTALGNGSDGVEIVNSDNNTVADNLISGNVENGVYINGGNAYNNVVTGNKIGTDVDGTEDLGNGENGVWIGFLAGNNTIGGFTDAPGLAPGNLISGNGGAGVLIGTNSGFNSVLGNLIGTDITGTLDLGNSASGVLLQEAFSNQIGGDDSGDGLVDGQVRARNVISGNKDGIYITGKFSTNNTAQGNYVGTTIGGDAPLGNTFQGLYLGVTGTVSVFPNCVTFGVNGFDNPHSNLIGGDSAGAANVFSGNGTVGLFSNSFSCGGTGNTIHGNYVGTSADGTDAVANNDAGIFISSNNDTIEENVVSGNGSVGIQIFGSWTTIGSLANNKIGTNANGNEAVPNAGHGIRIDDPAVSVPGLDFYGKANDIAIGPGNLISGNDLSGVYIAGRTHGHTVFSNTIGLGSAGSAVPNGANGIEIANSDSNSVDGNVLSGNDQHGLRILGAHAFGNEVTNNMIGTDSTGSTAVVGNQMDGVLISDGAHGNVIGAPSLVTQGFGVFSGGNVISGNAIFGVQIAGFGTMHNVVQGNAIGTNRGGTEAIPNMVGVAITGGASENEIGIGAVVSNATGNLISGNSTDGVIIADPGSDDNEVSGNLIGTNTNGHFGNAQKIPNGGYGVSIYNGAQGNMIGVYHDVGEDDDPLQANVISGNAVSGVAIQGPNTRWNTVAGNFIGTNDVDRVGLGNGSDGVSIFGAAMNNTIGGTLPIDRNILSGNSSNGVSIIENASGNSVVGNYIGTKKDGMSALANGGDGVRVDGASSNIIGGSTSEARNIISGNTGSGVVLSNLYGATNSNTVQGNYIGTKLIGSDALPNSSGVRIQTQLENLNLISQNRVTDNLISGNIGHGVALVDSFFDVFFGVESNEISRNRIGLRFDGLSGLPNGGTGVLVSGQARQNTIGDNVISGNAQGGVKVVGTPTQHPIGNKVQGNKIGTNEPGSGAVPNTGPGVEVIDAIDTVIGGLTSTPGTGLGNLISGNSGHGIAIDSFFDIFIDLKTDIRGNAIGTKVDSTPLGNNGDGIRITGDASNNKVGDSAPMARNIIANNARNGVTVGDGLGASQVGSGNAIRGNSIFANGLLGIDLGNNGATANDPGDGDGGANHLQNKPVITSVVTSASNTTFLGTLNSTPNTTFTLDFYNNLPGGQTYLGSAAVTTDGSGNKSFAVILTGTGNLYGHNLTATATDTTVGRTNTSEFSLAMPGGDVTGDVQVTRSGYTYNRTTRRFIQTVTVKNNSSVPFAGPVSLILDGIAPALVFNKTGTTTGGSAYKDVSVGTLAAGASVSVVLEFTFTSIPTTAYTTRVLAGPGTR